MHSKKLIRCFRSMKGHNGFYYPNEEKVAMISSDSEIKILPWVGSTLLKPFIVNGCDIISEISHGGKTILWADKSDIVFFNSNK